jgi:hypothetical protein
MEWLSYVFLAATTAGFVAYGKSAGKPPLAPWDKVGSSAYVWLENPTGDSLSVSVRAPAIDTATRFLGTIAPHDGILVRLPYADTNVLLTVGPRTVELKVRGPGVYTP